MVQETPGVSARSQNVRTRCRKAASRAYLREAAQRQEAAWQQRLARWQTFQPQTRSCLERVEAVGGAPLAETIRRERERES